MIGTSGLYQHNPEAQRVKLLQREGLWRADFSKRIDAGQNQDGIVGGTFPLIPQAFQFATWDDQLVSHWPLFESFSARLSEAYKKKQAFKDSVDTEIQKTGRAVNQNTVGFQLEETCLTAVWMKAGAGLRPGIRAANREHAVHIAYPGEAPKAMMEGAGYLLQGQRGLLPLVWINTASHERVEVQEYQFGTPRSVHPVQRLPINP